MKTIRGVSQVAVFGDGHKYCVALVTIDPEAAAHILREAGQPPVSGLPALARDVTIHRVIAQGIAEKNALLASFETIKDFRVVPEEFSNELTSTLKLMRRRVAEKHGSLIDEMFARPE